MNKLINILIGICALAVIGMGYQLSINSNQPVVGNIVMGVGGVIMILSTSLVIFFKKLTQKFLAAEINRGVEAELWNAIKKVPNAQATEESLGKLQDALSTLEQFAAQVSKETYGSMLTSAAALRDRAAALEEQARLESELASTEEDLEITQGAAKQALGELRVTAEEMVTRVLEAPAAAKKSAPAAKKAASADQPILLDQEVGDQAVG